MSKRQRDVLRAVRSREQTRAVAVHVDAQARCAAAIAHLASLDAAHRQASAPPAVGVVTRVDREARRRHHLADLGVALQAARIDVQVARAALADSAAKLQQRVRDVQAVDVLDARAAEVAYREASRRSALETDERNRPSMTGMDDDALQ